MNSYGSEAEYSGTGNGDQKLSTETIRAEIDRTRADMDRTVDALQEKFDPQVMIHRTFDSIRENAADVTSKVIEVLRRNPVPAALIAIGLVWLLVKPSNIRRSSPSHRSLKSHRVTHAHFGSRFGRTESGSELGNPIRGSVSSSAPTSRIGMSREEGQSGCGGL